MLGGHFCWPWPRPCAWGGALRGRAQLVAVSPAPGKRYHTLRLLRVRTPARRRALACTAATSAAALYAWCASPAAQAQETEDLAVLPLLRERELAEGDADARSQNSIPGPKQDKGREVFKPPTLKERLHFWAEDFISTASFPRLTLLGTSTVGASKLHVVHMCFQAGCCKQQNPAQGCGMQTPRGECAVWLLEACLPCILAGANHGISFYQLLLPRRRQAGTA